MSASWWPRCVMVVKMTDCSINNFFSAYTAAPQNYNLRIRPHNRQLTLHSGLLTDRNFLLARYTQHMMNINIQDGRADVWGAAWDSVTLPGSACSCGWLTWSTRSPFSLVFVQPYKLSKIGNRSFKVASAQTWNSLPEDVTSSLLWLCRHRIMLIGYVVSQGILNNITIKICSIELKWDGKITKIWYDGEIRWIRITVWNGGDL